MVIVDCYRAGSGLLSWKQCTTNNQAVHCYHSHLRLHRLTLTAALVYGYGCVTWRSRICFRKKSLFSLLKSMVSLLKSLFASSTLLHVEVKTFSQLPYFSVFRLKFHTFTSSHKSLSCKYIWWKLHPRLASRPFFCVLIVGLVALKTFRASS